jgi:hypothetical protein
MLVTLPVMMLCFDTFGSHSSSSSHSLPLSEQGNNRESVLNFFLPAFAAASVDRPTDQPTDRLSILPFSVSSSFPLDSTHQKYERICISPSARDDSLPNPKPFTIKLSLAWIRVIPSISKI